MRFQGALAMGEDGRGADVLVTLGTNGHIANGVTNITSGQGLIIIGADAGARPPWQGAFDVLGGKLVLVRVEMAHDVDAAKSAITVTADGRLAAAGCVLKNQKASKGGAVYVKSGTASFTGCTLAYNAASNKGGAVCVDSGTAAAAFTGCTLAHNKADFPDGQGGAV